MIEALASDPSSRAKSMRAALAEATRSTHDMLSDHALLSRLLAPDLTAAEYHACLLAKRAFYVEIETLRREMGITETFGLKSVLAALADDLGPMDAAPTIEFPGGKPAALGTLYVAHGAQFGRKVVARAVARSGLDVPQNFLSLRQDGAAWSQLLATIEAEGACPEGAPQLTHGANWAFVQMGRHADAALDW